MDDIVECTVSEMAALTHPAAEAMNSESVHLRAIIIIFSNRDEYIKLDTNQHTKRSSYVLGSELWESKFDGLLI